MIDPVAILIDSAASSGGGIYTFDMYFLTPGLAKFIDHGDVVTDTIGNQYQITSNTTLPIGDGSNIEVQFLTNNVLPANDSGFDSVVLTPNSVDPDPEVSTGGTLDTQSLLNGPDYTYTVTASWNQTTDANTSSTNDYVIDANGKFFKIISFNNILVKWGDTVVIEEVDQRGESPAIGQATLFRPTTNFNLFQGTKLTEVARTVARNRDNFFIDQNLGAGGGGDSNGDYVVFPIALNATNISNGNVTLPSAPLEPSETKVTPDGGLPQQYNLDFTVSGTTLSWSGLGLDGILEDGDTLVVCYFQ